MLPNGGSSSQETSECQYSPLTRLEFASAWMGRISGCPSGPGVFGWMCNSPKYRPMRRAADAGSVSDSVLPGANISKQS